MKKFFSKLTNYIKESYSELVNKVSWPTRTEVINSSVVVLSASVIIAIVILAMDVLFGNVLMHLIYTGTVNF
ncbi:MAG: preprotein translocase subunit SecE [Bacteroidales bacterium]|nr:preprotein translocase subunit SecE [Bacteroidales bacterium]